MVQWLARWFGSRGIRVGAGQPRLQIRRLDRKTTKPANWSKRSPACRMCRIPIAWPRRSRPSNEFHCQLILLDDGFQHRRLARDLDIVLLRCPRALRLRPRVSSRHACASRSNRLPELKWSCSRGPIMIDAAGKIVASEESCSDTLRKSLGPNAATRRAHCYPADGKEEPLNSLAGRRVAAFCGIGNPAGFRRTLEQSGCTLVDWREFPDHHHYSPAEIEELARWAAIATRQPPCSAPTKTW